MEDKKAAEILIKMLQMRQLDKEEKEAISLAIGALSWFLLAQSRLKAKEEKRKK